MVYFSFSPLIFHFQTVFPQIQNFAISGPSAKERLEKYNVSPKIDRKSQKQVLDSFVDTLSDIVLDTKLRYFLKSQPRC